MHICVGEVEMCNESVVREVCVFGFSGPSDTHTMVLNHLMTLIQKPVSHLTCYCDPIKGRTCPVFEHVCGHVFSMYHLQQDTDKRTQTDITESHAGREQGERLKGCWC